MRSSTRAPRSASRAGAKATCAALGRSALWPANSLFVEGYLTTRGDAVDDTYRMIRDAGFEVEGNAALGRGERPTLGAGRLPARGGDGPSS